MINRIQNFLPSGSVRMEKPIAKKTADGYWNVTYVFTFYPLLWAISFGGELVEVPFVQEVAA